MTGRHLSLQQTATLRELGIEVLQLRQRDTAATTGSGAVAVPSPLTTPEHGATEAPVVDQSLAARAPGTPSAPVRKAKTTAVPPVVSETGDWATLNQSIRACENCALHATRTHAVCGVGATHADWLIVGEAPGADEDRKGEPFVGRAGQLLNEMLRAIGLQREQVYIANVLKCRPPDNRDPHADEIAQCLPYLERQIALLQPSMILVVGAIAAQTLLQVNTPVGKLRGQVHRYADVPMVVTYHPAYLLRSPTQKRKTWDDLLLAMDAQAG